MTVEKGSPSMKRKLYIIGAVIVLLLSAALPAYAHGGVRFGIGIGIGPVWSWWGPPYYPYYYAEPPVVIRQQPPLYYYEQQAPQVQEQPYYWYFCRESNAYYPYVKQCPGGWLKVVPSPPPPGNK
jgi:hypothetical protein